MQMTLGRPSKSAGAWCISLGLVILLALPADVASATPLRACAAEVDFPPFVFTSSSGFTGGSQTTGLSINVLQRALRRAGKEPANIERMPWRRCQEMVAYGQRDIAINVPSKELDSKRFLATAAFAMAHHVYFYSVKRYPGGAPLRSQADLKRYTVCGLLGSSLDAFGIPLDHQDTGSKNEHNAIIKVIEGRCDIFIEIREVVDSLAAHNAAMATLFGTPNLRRLDLPGDKPTGLHFAFSRSMKEGLALQKSFNMTIQELIENGDMARMTP